MVRTETASLDLSEGPITVTVLTRMRALNTQLPERKLLLIPSICILGNSLQNHHFLRLLPTDFRNLTIPGTMAFRPSVKVSWTDLCCEFYHRRRGFEMRPLNVVVILTYMDGCEPTLPDG